MAPQKKDYDFYLRAYREEGVSRFYHRNVQQYYAGQLFTKKIGRRVNALCSLIDRRWSRHTRNRLTRRLPVQKNKIFIMTFQKSLACNPRYIVEELVKRDIDLDIVVCGDARPVYGFEGAEKVRSVERGSLEHFIEQATSSVWIDNAINCTWFPMEKKPGQYYLDTWHGSLGLKRINKETQKPRWLWSAKFATKDIDCMFSNSTFETEVYRDAYWPENKIFEVGHARNDVLFDNARLEKIRTEVYRHYRLDDDVHVAIYAPTFREKDAQDFDIEDIKFPKLKETLEKKYGGTWLIFVRAHYRDKLDVKSLSNEYDFIIDAGDYPDMQELMCACEVGITDYSSWICDYVLLRRPSLLYVPDLSHYEDDERGFYYPLSETPFPLCKTFDELLDSIEGFDMDAYNSRVDKFLSDRGCVDDGHASERIADFIVRLVTSEEPVDISGIDRI